MLRIASFSFWLSVWNNVWVVFSDCKNNATVNDTNIQQIKNWIPSIRLRPHCLPRRLFTPPWMPVCIEILRIRTDTNRQIAAQSNIRRMIYCIACIKRISGGKVIVMPCREKSIRLPINSIPHITKKEDITTTINDCTNSRQNCCFQLHPAIFIILYSLVRLRKEPIRKWKKLISPTSNINVPTIPVTHPNTKAPFFCALSLI